MYRVIIQKDTYHNVEYIDTLILFNDEALKVFLMDPSKQIDPIKNAEYRKDDAACLRISIQKIEEPRKLYDHIKNLDVREEFSFLVY